MIVYYTYQEDIQKDVYRKLKKYQPEFKYVQDKSDILKKYQLVDFSLLVVEDDNIVYHANNTNYEEDIKKLNAFFKNTLMSEFVGKIIAKNADIYDLKIRQSYNNLSIFMGIVVNFILFVAKFLLGLFTNTISLTSDAINNLSDLLNNIVGYIGMKLSLIPPDKEHPYGHGRIEYVASLLIGIFILFFGFELFQQNILKIITPTPYKVSSTMYFVLMISIILKFILFRMNLFIGKKIDAKTLVAIAKDAFNDVLINVVMIINLIVYQVWHINVDGYTGLIISVVILLSGQSILKEMIDGIIGQKNDEAFLRKIKEVVLSSKYAYGAHDLVLHNYGAGNYWGSIHVEVSSELSILEVHNEFDKIEKDILEKFHVKLVIHLDPIEYMNQTRSLGLKKVQQILNAIYHRYDLHDFRFVHRNQISGFEFEIELEYEAKKKEKVAYALIEAEIKKLDSEYFVDVKFEYV